MVVDNHASSIHLVFNSIANPILVQDVRLVLLIPTVVKVLLLHQLPYLYVRQPSYLLLEQVRSGAFAGSRRPSDQDVGKTPSLHRA
eukprot:CAMPEP_0182817880 /NCGR_PEP_ID=MMETSP0006_2-20121128/11713_1 /TAXON_ID=97485 /ORGANISM="Prymnesium parvum, Strain Texoma1" /LENGTH=85 /DNA_ID=CAMNT_0024944281 /DNA_START=600 /DNA_END=857 /DNA_ORIENTATION=-